MEKEVHLFRLNDVEGSGVDFIETTATAEEVSETFDEYVYGEESSFDDEDRNIVVCLNERGFESKFVYIETINY